MLKPGWNSMTWFLGFALLCCASASALSQVKKWQSNTFAEQKDAVLRVTVEWSRLMRAAQDNEAPSRFEVQPPATGTAFVISKDGDALTAAHVIAGWNHSSQRPYRMDEVKITKVTVHRPNGAQLGAQIVPSSDALHLRDVAILKIDGGAPWVPVCFAELASASPAIDLLAIGYEGGHSSPSPAEGALRNSTGVDGNFETSLATTKGFSGGPVFNQAGLVVGMARAGLPTGPVTLMVPEREFRDARKDRTDGACGTAGFVSRIMEWLARYTTYEMILPGIASLILLSTSAVVFLGSLDTTKRPLKRYHALREIIAARRKDDIGVLLGGLLEVSSILVLMVHAILFGIGFCVVAPLGVALGLVALAIVLAIGAGVLALAALVIGGLISWYFGSQPPPPRGISQQPGKSAPATPIPTPPKTERFLENIAIAPPVKIDGTWVAYPVVGQDAQKLYADFVFYAMDTSFYWQQKSVDQLTKDGRDVSLPEVVGFLKDSFGKTIVVQQRQIVLADTKDLVILGTSSQNGARTVESARALQRATNVAREVLLARLFAGGVYTLNLGQAKSKLSPGGVEDSQQIARQRPLVVVFILGKDPGVNLGQAIANAMNKRADLPHQEDYWEFVFQKLN